VFKRGGMKVVSGRIVCHVVEVKEECDGKFREKTVYDIYEELSRSGWACGFERISSEVDSNSFRHAFTSGLKSQVQTGALNLLYRIAYC
jgi:hypothetical protein